MSSTPHKKMFFALAKRAASSKAKNGHFSIIADRPLLQAGQQQH
jgi:hypothetical protein